MFRFAIIGAGGWGRMHIENILKNKQVSSIFFIDKNPDVLKSLQSEYGVDTKYCFTSLDKVLKSEKFDAAIIIVPNPHRIKIVEKLLAKNIHCLIEKPSAHSVKDLRLLKKAKENSKAILMVAQNYRFLKSAKYIRELITSGQAGAVRHISLYFCRNEPFLAQKFYSQLTGPKVIALELGVHHIDLLNYFIGDCPEKIFGRTWHEKNDCIKADCHLSALLIYPNNISVNYTSTLMGKANRTNWTGRFEINCDNAHIVWDENDKERIKVYKLKKDGRVNNHYKIYNLPPYPENSVKRCQDAFIGAIKGSITEEAKGCFLNENAKTLLTAVAIHESGKKGKVIDFPEYFRKEYI